jgi:hypothetical protein
MKVRENGEYKNVPLENGQEMVLQQKNKSRKEAMQVAGAQLCMFDDVCLPQ